jgi:hypothetical protein
LASLAPAAGGMAAAFALFMSGAAVAVLLAFALAFLVLRPSPQTTR